VPELRSTGDPPHLLSQDDYFHRLQQLEGILLGLREEALMADGLNALATLRFDH
jgi:hypothetical protein